MTLRRYLRLLGIYIKMDLSALARDTKFMIICIFTDLLSNIASISGVFLLAWKFDGIGGLGKYEVLLMLAYGNLVSGLLHMTGGCNALFPSRIIARGQWEHMFLIPLPYWVQLTIGIFPFTCSGNFISGIVMLCIAVRRLDAALPVWWAGSLIGNLFVSMAILVGLSYLVASLAFYAPVQCEEISSAVIESAGHTANFPLSEMPLYLKLPLLTIFPAGLLAWFPTMLVLGKAPAAASFYPVLFAVMLSAAAAYFFRKGFRYYVQKGINRYHPGGHRC